MNDMVSTRSLEVIGAEIRALTASMLGNVIEIGRRMVEAKELLPHGEFGPWIKENTGYSSSTANNFMRLFEEYGARQQSLFGAQVENFQTFGNLSYTKALALLAIPSEEEREEFVETHDVESMSTRELQQALKERDEALKAQAAAEAREKEARAELAETADMLDKTLDEKAALSTVAKEFRDNAVQLEKELEELKGRPVEVAVQEPDPAMIQERAEVIAQAEIEKQAKKAAAEIEAARKAKTKAEEDARVKLKAAETARVKLEASLKEAEEKLAAAGAEDKAEVERLRAETEQLQKQLAMSDAATAAAKVLFSAWQEAYRKLREAVEAAPARDKLLAAMKAQANAWAGEADT